MKSKILLVSYNGSKNGGGVERVVSYWCNALGDASVVLISKENFPFLRIFGRFRTYLFPLAASFFAGWQRKNFNLVVAHGGTLPFFSADIAVAHGTTAGYIRALHSIVPFRALRVTAMLEGLTFRRARRVLAVSDRVADELTSLYQICSNRVHIVPNCVDSTLFSPFRRKSSDQLRLIFVGRLEAGKGLASLVEFSQWVAVHTAVKLTLMTTSKREGEQFIGKRNVKVIEGCSLQAVADILTESDVLILPSYYEGFEMVTLEALASGVAVIGTDVGAIHFINRIRPHTCGLLSSPESVDPKAVIHIGQALLSSSGNLDTAEWVANTFSLSTYTTQIAFHVGEMRR